MYYLYITMCTDGFRRCALLKECAETPQLRIGATYITKAGYSDTVLQCVEHQTHRKAIAALLTSQTANKLYNLAKDSNFKPRPKVAKRSP